MIDDLIFEPLGESHVRADFTCSGGDGILLQTYLRDDARALREHRRHVAAVHVMARASNPGRICGYFTLASATLELEELPKAVRRTLPRYRPMPALKLGRMAVSDDFRGHDLGTILIEEAFRICVRLRASIGFVALLVDAKTDELVKYYEKRGFMRFPERQRSLYIMQATMAQIVGDIGA